MGILEDIMLTLERIPIWKRLQGVPTELDQLKDRVAELETKLGGKWPAEVCRYCGERAVRLKNVLGPDVKGMLHEAWLCSACHKQDERLTKGR